MMRSRNETIAFAAVFTALGLILGYIDQMIPLPVHVPGVKIGIANIVTVVTLILKGPVFATFVLFVRVLLSSVLFGSPVSFIYSISGAVVSLSGMWLLNRFGFSVYGISVAGAVLHNAAQITVALIMVGSGYMLYYLPVLTISGVIAGLAVGFLSKMLISRLNRLMKTDKGEGKGSK